MKLFRNGALIPALLLLPLLVCLTLTGCGGGSAEEETSPQGSGSVVTPLDIQQPDESGDDESGDDEPGSTDAN